MAACNASSDMNQKAREFHDAEARSPDLSGCMAVHQQITELLRSKLTLGGPEMCADIQYTGSSYEGTKVHTPASNYEFDLMIVRRLNGLKHKKSAVSGFHYLYIDEGEYINSRDAYTKFKGSLQKAINDLRLNDKITIVDHGPAIDLVVVKYNGFSYSVDMAPAYAINISGKDMYFVPKEPKPFLDADSALVGVTDKPLLWFESHALDEKNKLVTADKSNGCRRDVYRMCKVIRDRERFALSSYMLKNALLHEMDAGLSWDRYTELGARLVAVLERIIRALDDGRLPAYFIRDINLLAQMKPSTRENIAGRLRSMIANPDKLFRRN